MTKNIIFLRLAMVLIILTISINALAQFSSNNVYYYKFHSKEGIGVYNDLNLPMDKEIYIFFFNGDYMMFLSEDLNRFRTLISEDEMYWEKNVKKWYNKFADRYNSAPTQGDFPIEEYSVPSLDIIEANLRSGVHGYKYNPSLSSDGMVTYTTGGACARSVGPVYRSQRLYWSSWYVSELSFTFSDDKSSLIIWRTDKGVSNSIKYKRIEFSNLKPNLDEIRNRLK